jgi:hypothetical protein
MTIIIVSGHKFSDLEDSCVNALLDIL